MVILKYPGEKSVEIKRSRINFHSFPFPRLLGGSTRGVDKMAGGPIVDSAKNGREKCRGK